MLNLFFEVYLLTCVKYSVVQFPLPISKCTCKCIVAVWNLSLFSWIEISLPSSQFVLEVEDTNVCLLDAKTSVAAGQQLGSTEIVLTDRSILGPCTWTCIRCLNFKHIATCSIDNMCLGCCFYWYKFSGYQIHSISILHWDFIYWILETDSGNYRKRPQNSFFLNQAKTWSRMPWWSPVPCCMWWPPVTWALWSSQTRSGSWARRRSTPFW